MNTTGLQYTWLAFSRMLDGQDIPPIHNLSKHSRIPQKSGTCTADFLDAIFQDPLICSYCGEFSYKVNSIKFIGIKRLKKTNYASLLHFKVLNKKY